MANPNPQNLTEELRRRGGSVAGKLAVSRIGRTEFALRGADALLRRFETQVDPEGRLSPAERRQRALDARAAHMRHLANVSRRHRARRKAGGDGQVR